MRPLYLIESDVLQLDALLDDCEGDLSKAEPGIQQWFDALGDEVLTKTDAVIDYCRQLRVEAEGAKAEAARWQAACVTRNLKADRIEGALLAFLDRHGYRSLSTATGRKITIAGNGGKRPVVFEEVINPEYIEPRFRLVRTEIDREAVRAALEAGEQLPFAKLGERGFHMRIK